MTLYEKALNDHYGTGSLWASIRSALLEMGKDLDQLTVDDLAPVDMFHMRGKASMRELVARVNIPPHHRVLDVGCGIGGPVRYLANRFGCQTVGVDITKEYISVAEKLSRATGLDALTSFHPADALKLPFADDAFDVVWTEHVQMNIEDKSGFYREIARVLKPGGLLVFNDVFSGNKDMPYFPVPWAEDETLSFLTTANQLQAHLSTAGFSNISLNDKTQDTLNGFLAAGKRMKTTGPTPHGIHPLLGASTKAKTTNLIRNLSENRLTVIVGTAKKV